MKRLRQGALVVASSAALAVPLLVAGSGTAAHAVDPTKMTEVQEKLLSGFASYEFNAPRAGHPRSTLRNYFPRGNQDCGHSLGPDVRVNQDCLNVSDPDLQGRGQAQNETSIAQDPRNLAHLIGTYNDYRRGDGTCGASYSLDGGRTWNDSTVPDEFTRGQVPGVVDFGAAREYWQGGGDTSIAWDTKGNAYLSCQLFNRGTVASPNPDASSALAVFRSTQNNGASWNFPGRYVRASNDVAGTGAAPFLDKQLMTVDNNPVACSGYSGYGAGRACTRFQDRVYVTWTEFAADGTAFIYEAYSADYAEHFSAPHLVSRNNPALCTNDYGLTSTVPSRCNENQDSQPFVGPDGALYVVFDNFNNTVTGGDNRNQMLLAKSVDGGNSFSAPVKVGDFYDLPDCATYQGGADPGRACVPEKNPTANSIFRANNYASGAVDPTRPGQVVVTYGSYINPHSNEANGCVPNGFNSATGQDLYTGVKTPGACNNDILYSVSTDGGATFTGSTTDPRQQTTVNQDPGQATTDQFWQWAAFTRNGKLAVSYYDRQYGNDEATGFSDVTLSGSADLTRFGTTRATSSSMPFPTEFDGLFFGDYAWVSAVDVAYPLWMDTRNPDVFLCPNTGTATTPPRLCTATDTATGALANDQDIYTVGLQVPAR